jgi:hypothetical protein
MLADANQWRKEATAAIDSGGAASLAAMLARSGMLTMRGAWRFFGKIDSCHSEAKGDSLLKRPVPCERAFLTYADALLLL